MGTRNMEEFTFGWEMEMLRWGDGHLAMGGGIPLILCEPRCPAFSWPCGPTPFSPLTFDAYVSGQRRVGLTLLPYKQHVTAINNSFKPFSSKLGFIISPTFLIPFHWAEKWCIQGHSLPWGQHQPLCHQWLWQGPPGHSHQVNVILRVYKTIHVTR